jgi:hypothetical protein
MCNFNIDQLSPNVKVAYFVLQEINRTFEHK